MKGLKERIESADEVECRINGWRKRWRLKSFEHERLMRKTLHRANLQTQCRDCGWVMETAISHIKCTECGSSDTASPYYL